MIDEAKRLVPVPELAEKQSGAPGVKRGRELAFICPLHDDDDPSLRVDPDRDIWYCDPCVMGGSVVELYRLVSGYAESQAREAAADLLLMFGHELPPRPASWFKRQHRQKEARQTIENAKVEVMARRMWRWIIRPLVMQIEDEYERVDVTEGLWPVVRARARELVEERDREKRREST